MPNIATEGEGPLTADPSKVEESKACPTLDLDMESATADQHQPKSKRRTSAAFVELFAVALISTALGAIGAYKNAAEQMSLAVTIPSKAPVAPSNVMNTFLGVALFRNGEFSIDKNTISVTERWAKALSKCQNGEFVVSGSASSVPYRDGSKNTNIHLANKRAEALRSYLAARGVQKVTVDEVKDDLGLSSARRLQDKSGVQRDLERESVTRRADLRVISFGSCETE